MRSERVTIRPGLALRVLRQDGPHLPVLLVHGLASNARLWDGVATELARAGHATVAVDLPGHGQSDRPDSGYSPAAVADDLAGLLRALAIGRCVVAGQSWGGNVVLELARRHPAEVAAVGCVDGGWIHLADSHPVWEDCERELAPPPLAGTPRRTIDSYLRRTHPDWSEQAIEGALANFETLADGTVRPWLTRERHLTILRALWEHQPRAAYRDVHQPVLLLPARSADPSERGARLETLVAEALALLPNGRARWFGPPADHDLHAQFPAEVAAALLTLIPS
jgi:pimeloyl-ACP methyl ester carboxylesterase